MKSFLKFAGTLLFGAMLFSCQQADEPLTETGLSSTDPASRAYGDKTPKIAVYVETNDVNPLNAGDYYYGPAANNVMLIDMLELFASNIHKETVGGQTRPTLYLNDKLTRILEPDPANPTTTGYHKYVKPLRDKGIKVLLSVLGDWQGIGVGNMNSTQTTQFAAILAYVVDKYGLDGLGFDDEYSDYGGTTNTTSYSEILTKVHALMPSDKIITLFEIGNITSLTTAAKGCLDYSYHAGYGAWKNDSDISIPRAQFSPISINLGSAFDTTVASDWAADAADNGYGAMMCFNIRTANDRDPLPVFNAFADGAWGATATRPAGAGNRSRDQDVIQTGFTITYDDTL